MTPSQENDPGRLWRHFLLRVGLLFALPGIIFFSYNLIAVGFDIGDLAGINHRHQLVTGTLILLTFLFSLAAAHGFSRRLDHRLREISRRYEDLLQSTESIVWEADPDTLQLSFVSDQVQRLLGFPPADCLQPDFWLERIHPHDLLRVVAALKAQRGTACPLRIDYRMIDRQGREVWMQDVVVAAGGDGGRPVLRGVLLDISERKTAEKRVQDMLAEQYAILQNALVGIALIRHGLIVSCNHRFEQIFGAARFSLSGQPVRSLYPSEEDFVRTRADVGAAFEIGCSFTQEILLVRRDGMPFWGAMTGQLLDVADPAKGAIWIYADISVRKAAQAALKEQQARLEQLVEQRTADLRQALDAAHAADRAKDEFLANISHEMRTPLNAVLGLSGLARRHSGDPQVHDYLDKVTTAGQTLLQIINDLLDLSKIAAGHLQLETIPFRLGEIVDRLKLMVTQRVEDKHLSFDVLIDPALPAVMLGDPLRVEQIVLNLLTNAVKFTDQGGIVVRFSRHDTESGKVGLTIVVEDSGKGMTAAERERLFQPFAQADTSIARTHGGTGLGLTICRRFAEMMAGDVRVASTPDIGSTFTVRLQLDAVSNLATLPAMPLLPADLQGPVERIRYRDTCILIVDDQPINRQIVRELLADVGIVCVEADSGQLALATLAAHAADHFALVLMDVQMPGMDGHAVTRQLRENLALVRLPVIAMTAFAMEHERLACLAAGMNDHLSKPFDPQRLYRLLALWIPADRQYLAAPAAAPGSAADALAIEGIDTQAGINRFAGNREAYRRWLANFLAEAEAPLAAVTQELAQGRRDAALRALHTFKGRCGMLGMTALWQAVIDLESALQDELDATGLLDAARARHAEVLARVRAALG